MTSVLEHRTSCLDGRVRVPEERERDLETECTTAAHTRIITCSTFFFDVDAMSLTPTSTRVLIVGGVVCAGTLWCARPTKDQAPTDDTLLQFGQYMIVTYVVTLAVALFLAAPSMSKSNTLAMHAGIIGMTTPLQLVAFTSVGIFVEFCRFLTFGK